MISQVTMPFQYSFKVYDLESMKMSTAHYSLFPKSREPLNLKFIVNRIAGKI
jgi:hypothetical protein